MQKRSKGAFYMELAGYMTLARRSLSRDSIKLKSGSRRTKALMWAAARLTDLEAGEYKPAHNTLSLLHKHRENSNVARHPR